MNVKEFILQQFNMGDFNWITPRALSRRLGFNQKGDAEALLSVLSQMEKEGSLVSVNGKYALLEKSGLIVGKIKRHERGFAFLIPDDKSADLFVPPKYLCGAYQGDKVLAQRLVLSRGDSDECAVVKILERGVNRVIGVYFAEKGYGFVCPDDKGFGSDVYIKKGKNGGAKTGQKVVCEITGYPFDGNPTGEISAILGNPLTLETQVKSVLIQNNAPESFPLEVVEQSYAIPEEILQEQLTDRTDFTKLLTVTIDGEDARDFDDAISIQKVGNEFLLHVHIADVSAYVKPGDAIDREAYERGTSIYMPERVIPMLPERLCNGICSLNPMVKRLALTVEMRFDKNGALVDKSFYKSIIESNYRMTYTEVQAIFDGNDEVKNRYKEVLAMLSLARELKNKILALREEKGSVDLDVQETAIKVKNGEISVDCRQGIEAERVIEQFMISANVAVAEFIHYAEMPGIYRVHESPSAEKGETFLKFLNAVGVRHGKRKMQYPKDYQQVLKQLEGNVLSPVVNTVMLKSMQKAEYSSQNKGHFGLNETCYCHFTSPIRRYPDLIMHRILKGIIEGDGLNIAKIYGERVSEIAEECSVKERRADTIERSIDDLYACKFMSQFIGDFFEGIVSGVTSFGVFVRLANSVEGLVPLDKLPKGRYDFNADTFTLQGQKHSFSLGNKLLVKLVGADISSGKIAFSYIGKI